MTMGMPQEFERCCCVHARACVCEAEREKEARCCVFRRRSCWLRGSRLMREHACQEWDEEKPDFALRTIKSANRTWGGSLSSMRCDQHGEKMRKFRHDYNARYTCTSLRHRNAFFHYCCLRICVWRDIFCKKMSNELVRANSTQQCRRNSRHESSLLEGTSSQFEIDRNTSSAACQRRAHAIRHPKSSRQTTSKANL